MTLDPYLLAILATITAVIGLPWAVVTWGRRLERRAPHETPWSRFAWRWLILVPLVPMGAYLVIGNTVMKWGWAATIWIFAGAALNGLLSRDA